MKKNAVRTIVTILVVLLILAMIGFYLYEVIVLKKPVTENLVRVLALLVAAIGTLVKLYGGRTGRGSLQMYEKAYANELGKAFSEDPKRRKKLLNACRYYDESNYPKALKCLSQLQKNDLTRKELVPVLLFTALCYTDAQVPEEAIRVYERLLAYDPGNSQVHSNLGLLYASQGQYEKALQQYGRSIDCKRENYYAYVNRANCYFKMGEYDPAIEDALTALTFKNNGHEAASLLAILYAMRGDEQNKNKYFRLYIAAGKSGEDLNNAIDYYTQIPD